MSVAVRIHRSEAGDDQIPLPSYESDGAAGMDVRANLHSDQRQAGITLRPMARAMVPTALLLEIPAGYEIQVRPRSGLSLKQGLTLVNAPGTIDSDYRGELGLLIINLGTEPVLISHGMRLAQLVLAPVARAEWMIADELSETARGAGGFGSTGRN